MGETVVTFLLPFFQWASNLVSFESFQLNYFIAGRLFPMNSGDLGFYLGIIFGLFLYLRLRNILHQHYSLKWFALASVPFVSYWLLVIRVQRFLYGLERVNDWVVPPSKELYTMLGIACGMAAIIYVLYHLSEYHAETTMLPWIRWWNWLMLPLIVIPTMSALVIDGSISSVIFVFLGMVASLGVLSFLMLVSIYFGELMADVFVNPSKLGESVIQRRRTVFKVKLGTFLTLLGTLLLLLLLFVESSLGVSSQNVAGLIDSRQASYQGGLILFLGGLALFILNLLRLVRD